jgi:hypothetical protein
MYNGSNVVMSYGYNPEYRTSGEIIRSNYMSAMTAQVINGTTMWPRGPQGIQGLSGHAGHQGYQGYPNHNHAPINHYTTEQTQTFNENQHKFKFYYDKFIRENIQRMVIFAPRQSGKSYFITNMMRVNPMHTLKCLNSQTAMYFLNNAGTTVNVNRVISNDEKLLHTKTDLLWIDECQPHIKYLYGNRCIMITTPTAGRWPYSSNDFVQCYLTEYEQDREEYETGLFKKRFTLPEELFEI